MASFNQVILMGNLTRDPQLKYLPSQTPVAEFGLACNRKFKTQNGEEREEVLFVDCSAFGKTGELINQYFTKGKPIFIQGRLKYDSWEDKQGGGKRSKHSVTVDNFQLLGGPQDRHQRQAEDRSSRGPHDRPGVVARHAHEPGLTAEPPDLSGDERRADPGPPGRIDRGIPEGVPDDPRPFRRDATPFPRHAGSRQMGDRPGEDGVAGDGRTGLERTATMGRRIETPICHGI